MRKIRGISNGLRSGAWSENKFTNLVQYSPYNCTKLLRKTIKHLKTKMELFSRPINQAKALFIL